MVVAAGGSPNNGRNSHIWLNHPFLQFETSIAIGKYNGRLLFVDFGMVRDNPEHVLSNIFNM